MTTTLQVQQQPSWTAELWDWPLQHHDGVVRLENTKDKFEVAFETQFFTPDEIQVGFGLLQTLNYKLRSTFYCVFYQYCSECDCHLHSTQYK